MSNNISYGQANASLAVLAMQDGVRIFPCRAGDDNSGRNKSPLTRRGYHDAVCNLNQLGVWAYQYPHAMYGLPCALNNIFVLDADRHGNGDGVEALRLLFDRNHFDWRTVPCIRTPNDGLHVIFQRPIGLGKTLGRIAPAIDTRDNGYIILPGSTLADGRHYAILNGTIEQLFEYIAKGWLPITPDWLRSLIEHKPAQRIERKPTISMEGQRRQLEGILNSVTRAAAGSRNNHLHWTACRISEFVALGSISFEDAQALLLYVGTGCGLDETEVQRTVRSGLHRAMSGAGYG